MKTMGPRRHIRKSTVSRYQLCRWNVTNVVLVLVCSVTFSGLYNNECWQQEQQPCSGSTISLFAEAVSVAVVAVSSNGDDEAETTSDGSSSRSTKLQSGRSLSSSSSLSSPSPSSTSSDVSSRNLREIFRKAGRKALGGGLPGAVAGVVQVLTLMWLRTTINYQCRYGSSFFRALSILYQDGGIRRFYRGIGFALIQAPFTRFVATASNEGVLALLAGLNHTKDWTPAVTTIFASLTVGFFRILLMPIDTCKTVLQVDSKEGFRALMRRVRAGKISALYQGAAATAVSSTIGHYPWFVIYNGLSSAEWLERWLPKKIIRNASIGLVASVVSDTIINVFRVIKTTKQSIGANHDFSYHDTIRVILAADGWKGLFGRGLRTRVLSNSVQSILFTVIWRGLAERWGNNDDDENNDVDVDDNTNNGGSKSGTVIKTGVRSSKKKVDEDKRNQS
jgi:hypothetical protein